MKTSRSRVTLGAVVMTGTFCTAGATLAYGQGAPTVPLTIEPGVPLRLVLSEKLHFRPNEPVKARLVDPVYVFDRELISPGATVLGHIAALPRITGEKHMVALMGGDFTPLREPRIEFDTLVLNDGRRIALHTSVKPGTGTVVRFQGGKQAGKGRVAQAKEAARQQIEAKKRAVISAIKTPGKLHRLEDALVMRLPYHPQFYEAGTRFDADLLDPVSIGSASIPLNELGEIGSQPAPDSIVYARLTTALDSSTARKGQKVEAVLSRPLFSSDRHLVFPEGSVLHGSVVQARQARHWHRNGKLRFVFQGIEPPAVAAALEGNTPVLRKVEGRLESVEVDGKEKLQVDEEGGTKVVSSKRRFIMPAISLAIARVGSDNDPVRNHGVRTGAMQANTGGRALAGGLGFGVIGSALSQLSRPYAAAMGFYGLGWSVYSNLIARGQEVTFPVDTPVEIRLSAR